MISFIFLLIGLILVYSEFYLPSGIIAMIGGILILFSIVNFAVNNNSGIEIALYVLFTIIAIVATIRLALWLIVRAKPDYSIYSDSAQEGFQASEFDRTAIGKNGVVTTDLKPGGYISIQGRTYSAISLSGYITKGTEVTVVSGEGESLYVQKVFKKD